MGETPVFTLPMDPCASKPVTRVLPSPLCETMHAKNEAPEEEAGTYRFYSRFLQSLTVVLPRAGSLNFRQLIGFLTRNARFWFLYAVACCFCF